MNYAQTYAPYWSTLSQNCCHLPLDWINARKDKITLTPWFFQRIPEPQSRYFISSMDAFNPERLGQIVRAHWGIENNLHWVLDYAFREDDQRMRSGNSDANMAVVRHIALNLVKTEKTVKLGVKNKRLNAGWDEDYLLKIVTGRPGATKPET